MTSTPAQDVIHRHQIGRSGIPNLHKPRLVRNIKSDPKSQTLSVTNCVRMALALDQDSQYLKSNNPI